MGNVQRTQKHDDMARATASVMEERDDQKGGAGAEWKREEGDFFCSPWLFYFSL